MSNQQENTTEKAGSAVQTTPERSLQEFIHQNKAAYQKMMSQGPSSAARKIMFAKCLFDFFLSLSIIFAPIIFFDGLESRHLTYWGHLIDERKYLCYTYLILFNCSPCSVGMDPAGAGGLWVLVAGWDFAGTVARQSKSDMAYQVVGEWDEWLDSRSHWLLPSQRPWTECLHFPDYSFVSLLLTVHPCRGSYILQEKVAHSLVKGEGKHKLP